MTKALPALMAVSLLLAGALWLA
ncbi:MAG: hypothetical protein RL312_362, partial [Pseudomonadota bacterium]